MKRNAMLVIMLVVAVITVAGCSGAGSATGPGPGNQNASLTITMTSKPSISLTNISVLAATVGITGIALNPSTGTAVPVTLNPTVYPIDLARLQSDTAFLGSLSLAPGTYTGALVIFSAPVLTILNQTGGTLNGTCLSGTICNIVLTAGSALVTTTPFPLTLTSGQATGVSINLDLNTALTVTSGTLALNFSTANVATAATLPRTGAPTGSLDLVEDFVGKITATSSSSITVLAANGIRLQFKLPASPVIEDPQGLCVALNATCLVANQTVVSVDGTVNTDGTLTLVSADLLDATPQDEVEGTLLANGVAGQFFLVVSNKVVATGNSTLASANVGDTFLVTLNNPIFIVDTDEFFNNASLPASSVTTLFSSEADFLDGQDVMVHVTAATGTAAGGDQAITSDRVRLRFTRTTGTVQSVSGQSFTLGNVPPFIPFITNPLVDTIPGATNFDGVTDVNSVTAAQTVSIRALLLDNSAFSFYAAKVRVQP
ncbi:MAG: hypothetical protein M3P45_06975 [Acidobacteriota bacterium]|nr:hypothetical protein [Acidobacteriota bacterium]